MKKVCLMILSGLMLWTAAAQAQYSENDILIEKMVDKGYLSPIEADMIKEETREYVSKHMTEGRMMSLPQWIQRVQVTGDVRLRYEHEKRKIISNDEPIKSEQSEKLRLRLGIIARLNQKLTVAAGIATGSSDPRSDNITFDNSFEDADIRLDHAYAEYRAASWMSMIAGKYPKGEYLWMASDLFWDNDIYPEGASIRFSKPVGYYFEPFISGGRWRIQTNATEDDPYMEYAQIGMKFEEEHFDVKAAGGVYVFEDLKGKKLDYTSCSNSGLDLTSLLGSGCGGVLAYNYKSKGLSAEIGYKMMIHESYKRLALFADYMINDGDSSLPENLDEGWAYGMRLGDLKVKEPWQWQLVYQYSHIEKDVIPDIFPSSDRYGGQTGIRGHKVGLKFGLAENVTLGLTYYRDEKFQPYDYNPDYLADNHNPQSLYQVDLTFKF